jgi:hypothetical protein
MRIVRIHALYMVPQSIVMTIFSSRFRLKMGKVDEPIAGISKSRAGDKALSRLFLTSRSRPHASLIERSYDHAHIYRSALQVA